MRYAELPVIAQPRAGHRRRESAWVLAVFAAASAATASGAERAEHPAASGAAPTQIDAQGTGYAVPRYVIAGGGGSSSGGAFRVDGTIDQADADPLHPATGGIYAISGGFWPGEANAPPGGGTIFANGFELVLTQPRTTASQ